jgi:hypothetical protein
LPLNGVWKKENSHHYKIMIEILALIHFGFFGVMVIVMQAHAKMKDSKDF